MRRKRHIAIIELPTVTKQAVKVLDKGEREVLLSYLALYPDRGDVIPGTGGIRKMRWAAGGKGKRDGARIIYFHYVEGARLYLMACYRKSGQSDLSPSVKRQLKTIVGQIKGDKKEKET